MPLLWQKSVSAWSSEVFCENYIDDSGSLIRNELNIAKQGLGKKIFKDVVDAVSHETFVKIGTFLQEIFQAK